VNSHSAESLDSLAAFLAASLTPYLPEDIVIRAEGSTVVVATGKSDDVGGTDLANFAQPEADAPLVAFALERGLDSIQDFVSTSTGSPWPHAADRNELPVPDVQVLDTELVLRYVWPSGGSVELGRVRWKSR
jgi:hypothetical protein